MNRAEFASVFVHTGVAQQIRLFNITTLPLINAVNALCYKPWPQQQQNFRVSRSHRMFHEDGALSANQLQVPLRLKRRELAEVASK